MADEDERVRHSRAHTAELITDPEEKARKEARNALLQIDEVEKMVDLWLDPERPFKLRVSAILALHRTALDGLSAYAGLFRPAGVEIGQSSHEPPGGHQVPEYVEELCDYVNDNWEKSSAIHLASYVLWRLNWIHPFDDGNGRTSRAVGYLVLCVRLQNHLPSIGATTLPDLITKSRKQYYEALEAADEMYKNGRIDVSVMEEYLESLLARQLKHVIEAAGNKQ